MTNITELDLLDYHHGDIVTLWINQINIGYHFGDSVDDFDHYELYNEDDELVYSNDIGTIVIDEAIFQREDDVWVIRFGLFCFIEGVVTRVYYTTETWTGEDFYVVISSPDVEKRVVVQLCGGGVASIPLPSPSIDDKVAVLRLSGGDEVAIPLRQLVNEETAIIFPLMGGGTVSIPMEPIGIYAGLITAYWTVSGVSQSVMIGYTLYVKTYIPGGNNVYLWWTEWNSRVGAITNWRFAFNSTTNWTQKITGSGSVGLNPATWMLQFYPVGLLPGDYIRIDNIRFYRNPGYYTSFRPDELLPGGDFESGIFGDGWTNWSKNDRGKVRIIASDYYTGAHCVEFYG